MKKISIIIPVYNSSKSLRQLNNNIDEYISKLDYNVEKIFINDASYDNSLEVLYEIRKDCIQSDFNKIKIISLKKNYGQQNAIFCGLKYATGDLILTMDDDLEHDIEYLSKMIILVDGGCDLVYGVHEINATKFRDWGSKITAWFFKKNYSALKGNRVSSFRLFKRELLKDVLNCEYPFIYLSALFLKQDPIVGNLKIQKKKRIAGKSNYNLIKLIKLFIKLIWFYHRWMPEILKPRGDAYEEANDVGGRQLSNKCY